MGEGTRRNETSRLMQEFGKVEQQTTFQEAGAASAPAWVEMLAGKDLLAPKIRNNKNVLNGDEQLEREMSINQEGRTKEGNYCVYGRGRSGLCGMMPFGSECEVTPVLWDVARLL
ncbi:hypothetical protein BJ508DRAFT_380279 [Ascobolus immersus RN42]|uniref:Uncharacterized protein n=1 Tax=Ascobolus immersus RN42 TaxID=1160509 RepID=A0A3N4HMR5_ASCIM|nr:hypothetical protein BJ508DRAFT_380279 [Ascobolus immersus RN42]